MDKIGDLTTGNLWKKMLVFSIPLIITNMLQAIYNIVDMVIVGAYVGSAGLAAVSIGGQVTSVVLSIVIGISNAGAVMIAQLIGAKRKDEVGHLLGTMVVAFTLIALALTVGIWIFTKPLLQALNTPEEAFLQTSFYLKICMAGTLFVYLYNLMSAILRGLGNSKTPMFLVLFSTGLNILLDWIFVGVLEFGVSGAAAATLTSQIICAVMIIFIIFGKEKLFVIDKSLITVHRQELKTLIKIGLPQSVQFMLTNLSILFIGGMVNTYGVYASAAVGAVGKLSSFVVLSAQAVMGAIVTMSGQNIGARQYKRTLQGMGMGILYALPVGIVFYVLALVRPAELLGIFCSEAKVIEVGIPYLQIVAVSFVIETVMFCFMGVLTGAGYTNITLLCAIISSFGIRYGLARIFSTYASFGFLGIAMAYPIAPVSSSLICIFFILSGKWKKNRVKI